jgi:hypothetical protein
LALFFLLIPCLAWAKDDVKTYSVPKVTATNKSTVKPLAGTTNGWNVPTHWKEQSAPMALQGFSIGDGKTGAAKVTVSRFEGAGGGALANVNRWRGQLGLKPVAESELGTVTKSIELPGGQGTLMDASGVEEETGKSLRMVTIMAPRAEATWFFKLWGDASVVERESTNLVHLAQTTRF